MTVLLRTAGGTLLSTNDNLDVNQLDRRGPSLLQLQPK
jgi:hypothetical protein